MSQRTKKAGPSLPASAGYKESAAPTTANPPQVQRNVVESDLTVAHVASTVSTAFWQVDRALEWTADEVERERGFREYEKMARVEPIVAGILLSAKALTIGDGLSVHPAIEAPPQYGATLQQQRDYDTACTLRDYGQEILNRLDDIDDDPITIILDQLNAFHRGHTLAEIVRGYFPAGAFKGKYSLESVRVKPRENYSFVLDEMNRFRGVSAKSPGVSMVVWHGIIGDASYMANVVSPEKFIVLTVAKEYGDPRGVSMFRAIWDPYRRKQLLKPDQVKTGHQFGGGMISIIGPENFSDVVVTDPDTGEKINILVAIQRQAQKLTSGGVAVFPFGSEVHVHQPEADPKFFESTFNRHDYEMYQGFFTSAEAFLPSQRNSQANADTAQDTVKAAVRLFKHWVEQAWRRDVLKPFVRDSFGPDVTRLAPHLSLSPTDTPDFAVNAAALAALVTSGAVDDSQLTGFDRIFGYPQRDPNWMERKAEKEEQSAGKQDQETPGDEKQEGADKEEAA